MTDTPVLEVRNLNIRFDTPKGEFHAVKDVTFTMGREKLAIVGESGSGKTQTGRAILGLTPGRITADKMAFHGSNLLGLGVAPPQPEWGSMVSEGRSQILEQWWVCTYPGIAICIVSLGFNLIGDGLRDVLDPRGK